VNLLWARRAARSLLDQLEDRSRPKEQVLLPTRLVVRGSSGLKPGTRLGAIDAIS